MLGCSCYQSLFVGEYFFIYSCARSSLLLAGFSLVAASGGYSPVAVLGQSPCRGFSSCEDGLQGMWGFQGSQALGHRLSSCDAGAQLL